MLINCCGATGACNLMIFACCKQYRKTPKFGRSEANDCIKLISQKIDEVVCSNRNKSQVQIVNRRLKWSWFHLDLIHFDQFDLHLPVCVDRKLYFLVETTVYRRRNSYTTFLIETTFKMMLDEANDFSCTFTDQITFKMFDFSQSFKMPKKKTLLKYTFL